MNNRPSEEFALPILLPNNSTKNAKDRGTFQTVYIRVKRFDETGKQFNALKGLTLVKNGDWMYATESAPVAPILAARQFFTNHPIARYETYELDDRPKDQPEWIATSGLRIQKLTSALAFDFYEALHLLGFLTQMEARACRREWTARREVADKLTRAAEAFEEIETNLRSKIITSKDLRRLANAYDAEQRAQAEAKARAEKSGSDDDDWDISCA